jgi:hypothetical protein
MIKTKTPIIMLIIRMRSGDLARYRQIVSKKRTVFCGGYRSRTDDPLRARQML